VGVIRQLPEDQIEALLSTAIVGRIACSHPDHKRPYLVPLAFGYDGTAIYAHTGPGTKLTYMRANPLVSIEVDEATAPDVWKSVVAEGEFVELSGSQREQALAVIYPDSVPDLGAMTVVFAIRLTNKSGRYELPH
jgi:nitroimidazol reductase NimA-like FMN-containing flavoprotein (pyridoxamine 5'-phosphate oxidase superfamily)